MYPMQDHILTINMLYCMLNPCNQLLIQQAPTEYRQSKAQPEGSYEKSCSFAHISQQQLLVRLGP